MRSYPKEEAEALMVRQVLMDKIKRRIQQSSSTSGDPASKLDNAPADGYSSTTAMKNLWQPWQKRLDKVCASAGMKARLAREFKVSRQGASNWVTGDSEPTADYALHLIEWIKAEEAKPK